MWLMSCRAFMISLSRWLGCSVCRTGGRSPVAPGYKKKRLAGFRVWLLVRRTGLKQAWQGRDERTANDG